MKVSEKIRSIRKSKDWTQEDMAEKLNMSVNAYAKIELGETNTLNPKLEKIAQALGVELLELLSLDKNIYLANDNWNHNIIGSSSEIAVEMQKLQIQLAHKDETLAHKDEIIDFQKREIARLEEIIALMKAANSQTENFN